MDGDKDAYVESEGFQMLVWRCKRWVDGVQDPPTSRALPKMAVSTANTSQPPHHASGANADCGALCVCQPRCPTEPRCTQESCKNRKQVCSEPEEWRDAKSWMQNCFLTAKTTICDRERRWGYRQRVARSGA